MDEKIKKNLSPQAALEALQRYCAYQDRCHKEVRSKLLELGVYGDELEWVIVELITEGFLDEERFARSYARGKFRMKHWGKRRITQELKYRDISDYCIKKGLSEIEDEAYEEALRTLLEKKLSTLPQKNIHVIRKKLYEYANRKGYESFLIQKNVKDLTKG